MSRQLSTAGAQEAFHAGGGGENEDREFQRGGTGCAKAYGRLERRCGVFIEPQA